MVKTKKALNILLIFFLISLGIFLPYFLKRGQKITILYTTDLQGFITPHEDCWSKKEPKPLIGGSAYLATYVKKKRRFAERKNNVFILLDSGNFFQGQAEGYFLKGSSIIEIMNNLGYDAMAIGPKDFVFGEENLRNLAKLANFPFLSANIVDETTLGLVDYVKPFIIKEHRGIKIGIIGINTPSIKDYVLPENIEGLKFLDPVLMVQEYISKLNEAGIKLIIVLSNLGLEEDKRLAREVKGINVIIGGNTRGGFRLLRPFYVDPKNKTVIVESWEKGGTCYGIDIILDRQDNVIKYKPTKEDLWVSDIKPDQEIEVLVKKYINLVENKKKAQIGYAQSDFTRSIDQESNLGNWVADVLRTRLQADVAFVSGLQADLQKGDITVGDIYNIVPIIESLKPLSFNVVILELSGDDLKYILERSLKWGLKSSKYGILQVSGLKIVYDSEKKIGRRILEIIVNGEKLDMGKIYKVVVNGYLSSGGDGYYEIINAKNRYETGIMTFDILVEYVKTHSPITASPLEGRIVAINKNNEHTDDF